MEKKLQDTTDQVNDIVSKLIQTAINSRQELVAISQYVMKKRKKKLKKM